MHTYLHIGSYLILVYGSDADHDKITAVVGYYYWL